MEIAGKVALVTGGAVRVGRAISLMLAREGAHVGINYHRSAEDAQSAATEARLQGVKALPVWADVSDVDAVAAMARRMEDEFGGVDIIVNSASLFARTPFPAAESADHARWQQVTRILVDGPWNVCSALVPTMLRRGGGTIINIVDLAPWTPWRGFAAHTTGKAAMVGLTRQLALELAPTVRVNAVAPGLVLPPVGYSEEQIERAAQNNLLRRWGSPDDVSMAVRFLIQADFMTGEILTVDGGERLRRPG